MAPRFAIYFVPAPESTLWRFGCEVLGYDAYSAQDITQWHPGEIEADDWRTMTEDPRKYGFHATLKAPFRLAEGWSEAALIKELETFASCHDAVDLGACPVTAIASSRSGLAFLALVPEKPPAALVELESVIVQHFDTMRAPLNGAEIARRNPEKLSERQRRYLLAYGYPYVLEEFRFHMTLTGAIADAALLGDEIRGHARMLPLDGSVRLDRLALCRQDDGERFRIVATARLGGTRPEKLSKTA